jgi:hypothetical protein
MRFRVAVLAVAVVSTGVLATGGSSPAAAVPSPGRTELLSLASDGSQGGESATPVVSGDGRHTAFATLFALDPADDDQSWDIYVRSGNRTVRISEPYGNNRNPAISADGRHVAYDRSDDGSSRVFLCDRDQDGDDLFDEPGDRRCVEIGRSGSRNSEPGLSGDATRMVWNEHPAEGPPMAVTARLTKDGSGRLVPPESFVDLLPTDPTAAEVHGAQGPPRISANGRHVVLPVLLCGYYCTSSLHGNQLLTLSAQPAMYRRAVFAAELDTLRMTRLDVHADGTPVGDDATSPAISSNGRMVAFASMDWSTEVNDVVVLDRDPNGDGILGPGTYTEIGEGEAPVLSADGRYVAFHSPSRLVHNGLSGPSDEQVVVRDLRLPLTVRGELASPGLDRDCVPDPGPEVCAGNGDSYSASLSADGSVVVFASGADDLVTADDNGSHDIFARTFRPTVVAGTADFGTVSPGGFVERVITLRHKGFGPLRLAAPEVTGPQAGDFAVFPTDTCRGTVLHATESCVVSVRFRPAGTGSREATLRLPAGDQVVSVPLTGVASGPPSFDLAVVPPELAFPGERPALSVSLPEVVTVTNTGTSPLMVRSVTGVDGPALHVRDYLVVATNCPGATLSPGQSCTITVRNLPHGAGERPGAILIETNAFSKLITLRARGTVPTVVVNPGVVVAGRVVEMTGTGFAPARDVTIALPGNGSAIIVRTDQFGSFAVPLQVFDHGLIGSVVTWVTAPDTELLIPAPLLVVPGTYQPPTFIGRR